MKSPIAFLCLGMAFAASCSVDIPEEDTTPPSVKFKVTGGGIDVLFETAEDFERQLNLTTNATYRYTLTIHDAGGLQHAQWQFGSDDAIEMETEAPEPWRFLEVSPLSSMYEWRGDSDNPVNGAVLSGRFTARGQDEALGFLFFARDYGGSSGAHNEVFHDLTVFIEAAP